MKLISETEEGRDSIVVEGLLDPEMGEFLRMRGKMPGEVEAREMPVEEGTYMYVQPRGLTRESLDGATVSTQTVRVPAGSYSAEHVRYGGMDYGQYDWLAERGRAGRHGQVQPERRGHGVGGPRRVALDRGAGRERQERQERARRDLLTGGFRRSPERPHFGGAGA